MIGNWKSGICTHGDLRLENICLNKIGEKSYQASELILIRLEVKVQHPMSSIQEV